MTTDIDRVLMYLLLALLAAVAVLGWTRLLDLDDADLRYPDTPVPATVYRLPESDTRWAP